MKLLVVAAILGVCLADRLDNKYLPPRGNDGSGASSFGNSAFRGNSGFGGGFKSSGGFGQGSSGFGASGHGAGFGQGATQYSGNVYNAPAQQYNAGQQYNTRAQASADANAQILRSNSEVTAEGFAYDFETSNGIRADASGVATNGVQSHGSFGYKGDDGQDYSITYTADENGYQPQGAHLPTPPPIPEEILRSLEQNARDEAAGISDDGSYHGEGAGSGNSGYSAYSRPSGPSGPSNGGSFGGASNFGGHSNFGGASNFGGSNAASRQYLAPKAGPRPSGSGNFNAQSGYRY